MSQQINLYNPIYKQQKKYLSAVTMGQALGLILLGSLVLTGYAAYRSNRIQAEAAVLATQLTEVQNLQSRIAVEYPPRRKSTSLEAEVRQTEADLQSLQGVANILEQGDLGNTKGYARYLQAFARQIIDGVWLTGLSIHGAGAEIELKGRAVNPELIPAYIGRLKGEPVLQGKSFSRLEMQAPQIAIAGKNDNAEQIMAAVNYIEFSLQSTGLSGLSQSTGESRK